MSTKAGSNPTEFAYDRPVTFVRGQELRFPDLAFRFDHLVNRSMGHFGGHERFLTDYVFKFRGLTSKDAEHEVIWSHGYPGGMLPLQIKLGRRQQFDGVMHSISDAGGTITISRVPPDANHDVPVDFVRGRWQEYPAFDVTLSDIRSRPWSAAEKEAYLKGVREYHGRQGLAIPENLESFYSSVFSNHTVFEFVIRAGTGEQKLVVDTAGGTASFRVENKGYELRILEQIFGVGELAGIKATIAEV